jgi:arsenate reductase
MSHIRLYGIPHCDTVKRARQWLVQHGVEVDFHDFKSEGVPAHRLDAWVAALGWEAVLNRRGTTWRRLNEAARLGGVDARSASAVMRAHASVIKRPVVEWADGSITVGFDADTWAHKLAG